MKIEPDGSVPQAFKIARESFLLKITHDHKMIHGIDYE
jgi:hypothetical protein